MPHMTPTAHATVRDDVRLWSIAVAAFAIVLQALVAGTVGVDGRMAAAHGNAAGHGAGQGGHNHSSTTPDCSLCFVCGAAVAATGSPPAPAVPLPQGASITATRRRTSAARRIAVLAGRHSARGPPRFS